MKVLHIISGGDSGGAKTHVFALMDRLVQKIDVKIVCFTDGVFYQELEGRNVNYELLQQKSRFDMSVVSKLSNMIKTEGYDIVHSHGARANFIARALKRKIHIPVVTTVHSDYLLDFDSLYKKIFYTYLNIAALRKMDYYIGVSSSFKDMLISRKFRPNSIFTVYNGMDYDREISFDDKETFAKRIGIEYSENEIYVGIVGRHEYVKGHDVFIRGAKEVLDKCSNVKFLIAGDGENRGNLKNLARELGIEDKIIFAGFINDIYSFINFIDINVLSSRSESFPYVLLEGALMKKPTVSSAVGGIPDLIKDGETGLLFESENHSQLAGCILELISDREKRESFGMALYKRATENFSNESLAQTHVDIYNAILRDWSEEKKYDAVLSGYYGFNNSGDDALLFAICESLKMFKPDIRLLVLSAKPNETAKIYRTDAKKRFNLFWVLWALKNSKMLINGGGSLLQDATSSHSLFYYLAVMAQAKKMGLKLYIYANGIGPVKDKNKKITKSVIEKADMITLRDENSLIELADMEVQNKNVLVTADPAIILSPEGKNATDKMLRSEGIPADGKMFGIAIRQWDLNDKTFVQKLAKTADIIAKKYSMIPLFIPMRLQGDLKISERVAGVMESKAYILKNNCTVKEIIGAVDKCEFVIGMRLHTLIYAASTCTPTVGIVYDPKIRGFLEYLGQNRMVNADDFSEEQIVLCVDDIMNNKDKIKEELSEKLRELSEKAIKNAEIAVNLLGE